MPMHPQRKQRLLVVCLIVIGASVATGLVTFALRENINLFFPPADVEAGKAPVGRKIRVGGMVVKDSVQRNSDSLQVSFAITDYAATVPVRYEGILPDMFAEEQGAVASGILNSDGVLVADQVLAKHDENYMPPEVTAALEASGAAPQKKDADAGNYSAPSIDIPALDGKGPALP